MTMTYHRRIYRVPEEHEERFTADLWSHGLLGCEIREEKATGHRLVDGYFPDPPPPALLAWSLGPWHGSGVEEVAGESFGERDWLAEYRAAARPFEVGRGFLVDPRDPEDEPGDEPADAALGRTILRIPARTAFGTGSHESTRLAVAWLEELDLDGLDILDVGTGSGILAFIALLGGARRVVGFDLDPAATLVARTNTALNARPGGRRPGFFVGRLAALDARGPAFDLALVNVLPERILGEMAALTALLRPGARMVSSGNLRSRRDELLGRFAEHRLNLLGEKHDGEWTSFLLAHNPGATP